MEKKKIKLIAICLIIIMLFCNYFIPIAYAAENLTEDERNSTEEVKEDTVKSEKEEVKNEQEKTEEDTIDTNVEQIEQGNKESEEDNTKSEENISEEDKEINKDNTENVEETKEKIEKNEENSQVKTLAESTANSEVDEEVEFASESLKQYFIDNYDTNDDNKITKSEMAQITHLTIPYLGETATDLKGIENCINLQEISISNCSNFGILATLQNLQIVTVYDINDINELNNLKSIPNIKSLSLYNSEIDFRKYDITQLPTQIEKLELSNVYINDISKLINFSNLQDLGLISINSDKITGLEVINQLPNLKTLSINGINSIKDIEFLRNNQTIENLNITYNGIRDITPISTMKSLKSINIRGNNIQNLSVLENSPLITEYMNISQDLVIENQEIEEGQTIEIELPQTVKCCFDSNSSFHMEDAKITKDFENNEGKGAYISDDNTKIIINTKDLSIGQKTESFTLTGNGVLSNTQIEVHYTVRAPGDKENEVEFTDSKLKEYLLENYDADKDGKITEFDMAQITELEMPYINYNYITDLQGLEYATSLKRIVINNGKNLKAISNLKNLEDVTINNIYSQEDYNVIKEIANLKKLVLSNIDFREYKLSNLPKQIEELTLDYGVLESIQEIEQFTNLSKLEIRGKNYQVKEIQGLDTINKLANLKTLCMNYMELTNIEFLKNNAYIETLNVQGNKITDISVIKTMEQLKNIDIRYNNIKDITVLRDTELLKNAGSIEQSIQIIAEGLAGKQIEVDLPQTIKSALDSNDSTFYIQNLRIEQSENSGIEGNKVRAKISDDKTKLIIDTTGIDIGNGTEAIHFYGDGILAYTTISINYKVLANGDKTKEIEFGDENLKNYILQNHDIDKDGKITEFDMVQIQNLSVDYSISVNSIKGLEYAKNLEYLYITIYNKWENNQEIPADLSAIANFKKLKTLTLNGSTTNIDFIANMTNLEGLTISIPYNKTENINLIKNLTNLKQLSISGEIITLEPLRNLTKLEQLNINSSLNGIKNIEPLKNLTKIYSLYINRYNSTNNQDTEFDYSAIKNFNNITNLYITDNSSNFDCSWVKTDNLSNMGLEVNSIINESKIGEFSRLSFLRINRSKLKNMDFISNLKSLSSLDLRNNFITDLSPLENLNIYNADLSNNPVDPSEENNARIIELYKDKNLILTEYEKTKNLEFKDQEFKNTLLNQYDLNKDNEISTYEMEQITYLTANNLEHAEKLTNLETLYIYSVSLDAEGQKALIEEINKLDESVEINNGINTVNIDLGTFNQSAEKYEVDINEICPILKEWQTPDSRLYKGKLVLQDSYNEEGVGELKNNKLLINRNIIGDQTYTIAYGLEENYYSYYINIKWKNVTTGDNTKEISIKDEKLKEKLLQDYDLDKDGKFTEYDANNIGELNINSSDVTNLSGIENFKNLRVINAYGNNISDLEPLRNLTTLIEVNFASNKISNMEPIMGLPNLNFIAMSNNNITDISCLKNRKFKYITDVGLDNNYIDFSNNSKQLETYLNEVLKDIAKYGETGYGSNVKALICTFASSQKYGNPTTFDNEVKMDSKIKTKLIEAGADLNKDGKLTARELNESTHGYYNEKGEYIKAVVESLDLSNLGLTDLSGLEYLSELKELNLSHNQISNIEPLSHLMNLSNLDLSYNNITDISVLPYYADNALSEKTVNLSHNNIKDISSINNWIVMRTTTYCGWQSGGDPNFRVVDLDLSYNQIEDISGVKDYKCLAKLNLSNNKIKDISSLKNYNFILNEVEEEYEGSDYLEEQLEDFEGIDVSSNYIDVNSSGNKEAIQVFKNKNVKLNVDNQKKEMNFKDVNTNAWYYPSIEYVYNKGIILGTSDTTFNPNTKLTRGMLVTILHRMDGKPTPKTQNKFSDVSKSQYYYDAVVWATEKGIVHGYENGKFGPDSNITRQDLAVILRNFAQYKGKNVNVTSDLNKFKDGNLVSDYAKSAVEWAVGKGVITGNNNGESLTPHGKATRAETAGMMYNYCTKVNV